ncbi:glycosyltransferase [Celeribacter arenosi]|uniref:Glycosyltransferase 2-like domain-containing protein n=1 Tax=Celeribacter arenosi TaxID=792649 RepID=A0ABP7K3R9_9RHOB
MKIENFASAQATHLPAFLSAIQGKLTGSVIVVPCYNEAKRLDSASFIDYLSATPDVTFLFVNDGSTDATLDCLVTLCEQAAGRALVLDLAQNGGKAEAVRQGLIAACDLGAECVGYWDADLATPLDAIDDFSRVMAKFPTTQVVYGARRALLGHRIERTMTRRAVSRVCATLARQAVRLPIGDTQCGAKMLRNSRHLRAALETPFTAGWLFDVELFARLSARLEDRSRAFYEQPLAEWTEVAGSKVSGSAILKSGLRMLRLIAETRLGLPVAAPVATTAPAARFVPFAEAA